jgi:putative HNHc nuclease
MQRRPRRKNEKHLRFVRERCCIICGSSPCDAAHIKMADARIAKPLSSNIGMKADDCFTLPLCRRHHEEQHSMPERKFWDQYHIDAVLLALMLYSFTGYGELADHLIRINMAALRELA